MADNYPQWLEDWFREDLPHYNWYEPENQARGQQWVKAISAAEAQRASINGLVATLYDLYSQDRAIRAAATNKVAAPYLYVPDEHSLTEITAALPREVMDTISAFVLTTPPETLFLRVDLPIRSVVGRYGSWCVTICEMPTRDIEVRLTGEDRIAEGTIIQWVKQVGDNITSDDALCELATDKAEVEIRPGHDGQVIEIRAQTGETISIGDVIAVIRIEA